MAMGGGGASEEALKRSTDCVYFLASPLTCKKGSECEYRHSESARLNPKDCWYWQSGSCLNPKCPFRHPPLEGLTGTSSGSAPAPAPTPTQALAPTQMTPAHGPSYNSIKQSAPCYYFQQGFCLKGSRCPFMHGPPPTGNPALQYVAKGSPPTAEPSQMLKKDSWGLKECNGQQIFKVPAAKVPPAARNSVGRTETEPNNVPNNLLALHRHELARSPPLHASLSSGNAESGLFNHQVQPVDEHPHNGREADEFLAESSPGFDVLVEDDVEDGYFPNEDEFGMASAPDGRRMNSVNGFDYHLSDYEAVPRYEMDRYDGKGEYDRYAQSHHHLGSEMHGGSSKRVADRQLMHERVREKKNLDQMDGSDLRHQLKRKRLNGSRSAISPDRRARPFWRDDHHAEERYRDSTEERYRPDRRDQLRFPSERPISTRLRGRITLPRRTSPVNSTDHRSDREIERARHRGRSSPPRPMNHQRRRHLQDRIRRRSDEDFATDARNSGGQAINKDDSDSLDFAGPKSLAELKVAKELKNSQEQPGDSFNVIAAAEHKTVLDMATISQESTGSKPLSIMLEGNCEAAQGNAVVSNKSENGVSEPAASSHFHPIHTIHEANKDNESAPRTVEKGVLTPVEVDHPEMEEGAVAENVGEDHDLENGYDDAEGDAFKAEDDEYIYEENEEELDEDDDFARKVGSMFS
ncbi:CCCH zinc finger domain-containing protein [Dioscorea alata]|uniref:CCCH zinc finger domain-containing protein n=1 Tax=Dioscorea alata TaxID=55571 RepID=A0ACB7WTU9_DIOAL|nr:CCCH zinc finger domain-containing protein [Dioscorea alata]